MCKYIYIYTHINKHRETIVLYEISCRGGSPRRSESCEILKMNSELSNETWCGGRRNVMHVRSCCDTFLDMYAMITRNISVMNELIVCKRARFLFSFPWSLSAVELCLLAGLVRRRQRRRHGRHQRRGPWKCPWVLHGIPWVRHFLLHLARRACFRAGIENRSLEILDE